MIDVEWFLDLIEGWWARHLVATTILKPDESDGDPVDSISGWPNPQTQEVGQIPAARVEMFGHAYVPPRGQRCRALLRKAAGIVWPLGSKRYRPKGIKEGESCLYCTKEGTTVWLKQDGSLQINAAPGQDVVVNGGSAKVARQGDRVEITDRIHLGGLAVWMAQVEIALNALASGSVVPLSETFVADPGLVIKDGADHFKG
jgi:hypothetical protein